MLHYETFDVLPAPQPLLTLNSGLSEFGVGKHDRAGAVHPN